MNEIPWSNVIAMISFFVLLFFGIGIFVTGRWPWEKEKTELQVKYNFNDKNTPHVHSEECYFSESGARRVDLQCGYE